MLEYEYCIYAQLIRCLEVNPLCLCSRYAAAYHIRPKSKVFINGVVPKKNREPNYFFSNRSFLDIFMQLTTCREDGDDDIFR